MAVKGMPKALLIAALIEALAFTPQAFAAYRCFDTPGGSHRCACIGANECNDLEKSGYCKSDPQCDKAELGALICSCSARRAAKPAP
jgi:hypothetical protein